MTSDAREDCPMPTDCRDESTQQKNFFHWGATNGFGTANVTELQFQPPL